MRTLASSVLLAEAFVVFFAALVAKDLSGLGTATSVTGGVVIALVCLLLCGLLRHPWAYAVGTGLQVVLVLCGFAVPMMFGVGAVFALLWWAALHYGAKGDGMQAAYRELAERRAQEAREAQEGQEAPREPGSDGHGAARPGQEGTAPPVG